MNQRKVVVYIATSLDGYIAGPKDDLSFLSRVEKEGEDYGYLRFMESVDVVVMGRKTYDWVMTQVAEFPHPDKQSYIITHRPMPQSGNLRFYSGDLTDLVATLKQQVGKDIFVDGGAEIVNQLFHAKLIDELYISIIPVMLGAGVKLFQDDRPFQALKLIEVIHFETGLVQLHYDIS